MIIILNTGTVWRKLCIQFTKAELCGSRAQAVPENMANFLKLVFIHLG